MHRKRAPCDIWTSLKVQYYHNTNEKAMSRTQNLVFTRLEQQGSGAVAFSDISYFTGPVETPSNAIQTVSV